MRVLHHTVSGTPLGEYMRRFWQPVCLSEELGALPLAIRILGENLAAFGDSSGHMQTGGSPVRASRSIARVRNHRGAWNSLLLPRLALRH